MSLKGSTLGQKLHRSLLVFMLLLGGATAAIMAYGVHRTQQDASEASEQGFEEIGKQNILATARAEAGSGVLQMEYASQIGNEAARFMSSANSVGLDTHWDVSRLNRGTGGQLTDPWPDRNSDVLVPAGVQLTPAVIQDLEESSVLDAVFQALTSRYPGIVRGANFNAIAIYYQSVTSITRFYPPIGLLDRAPPNLVISSGTTLASPMMNPERKTVWSGLRQDEAGQGLIVSAWTPVYSGSLYRGVIGVDLSVAKLIDVVNNEKVTPNGYSFYVDRDGTIMRSQSYDLLKREMDDGNDELAGTLSRMRKSETGVDRLHLGGKDVYVAFAPLNEIGGSFAIVAPVEEMIAPAGPISESVTRESQRAIAGTLVNMVILFTLALAGVSYLNRRVLLLPIQALLEGTREVAAGNLDTRISVRGEDELALLAQSFNEMTEDIKERREALRDEVQERERAQEELRAVFAAMTDLVLVVDRDGTYLSVAKTAAPEVLLPLEELEGKTMYEIMPRYQADAWMAPIHQALDTGRTLTFVHNVVLPDGGLVWFSAAISPYTEDSVVIVARDISELRNARDELERRVEERTRDLQTVLDVSRNVASTLELRPLLRMFIDQVRQVADYNRSSIFLVEGRDLVMFSSRVAGEDQQPPELRFPIAAIEPVWRKVGNHEACIIHDFFGDSDEAIAYRGVFADVMEALLPIRSWMGVPLIVKDQVIGMITLSSYEEDFYSEEHVQIVTAIAHQAAIAIENARLYEQAQQLAAVEERQRLARELHDSVSQALYGIALGARTARTLLDRDPVKAVAPVDYVLQLAEAGLAEMRALIFELRPESLEMEGLVAALDKQVAATAARYGIEVLADLGEEPALELPDKQVFYRIGQEALHNVVKHAHATHVEVRLQRHNGTLALQISDNGIGFESDGTFPGHMGLVSMRERAASIGARLKVTSAPGDGTSVTLEADRPA
jgi:PAS domain S-box-containing protein